MKNEWWKNFYDENLAHMLLHPATGEESSRTCDFLIETLALSPSDHIFDQCCGTGRIALELAKRGFTVTGIDLAKGYIEEAQSANQARTDFHTEDAFLYKTPAPCDAVINWWTSFGYAESDTQNLKMLQRAFESLKPGRSFAMDYMNVPNLYRKFLPLVTTTREGPEGTTTLHRQSQIDFHSGQLHKTWDYHLPNGQTVQHETSTKLYPPNQLIALFTQAGFTDTQLFGDLDASALTLESPRCIIVGRKPTS
ncbi:class I SAM-dependent methyltransferase [Verrucomicrobiaceae bacterium 227]